MEIQGHCAPRFAKVKDAFAKNFAVGNEVGASFAATLNGELVVDLWGGSADRARTRPWQRDTLANVWSTTKAMAALCTHMVVDRGLVDLDAPVASYWPEFAANGKERLPVRWLLLSTSPGWRVSRSRSRARRCSTGRACARRSRRRSRLWEPGTRSGYHGLTFGHLVGEVVRRVDGRTSAGSSAKRSQSRWHSTSGSGCRRPRRNASRK